MAMLSWFARHWAPARFLGCLLGCATLAGCTGDTQGPRDTAAWQDEDPTREQIEAGQAELLRRVEVKREAAGAVLEGRITVAEASARFRALRDEARRRNPAADYPPEGYDEAWLCREVLDYAREVLRDRPEEAEEALARLERDIDTHLAQQGLTRLAP